MPTPATPRRTRAELAQIQQVLPTITGWPVSPEEWPSVERELAELRDAFDDGDADRIHRSFARLSVFARRFRQPDTSFYDEPAEGVEIPPQLVVELVGELIEKSEVAKRDGLGQDKAQSRNERTEEE